MTDPTALVDKADTLAAYPVWVVTITPTTGPAFTAANVPHDGHPGLLVSVGDLVRQARRSSSRGTLTVVLAAVPESDGTWWPEDAFGPSAPLEGSALEVTVEWGATTATVFRGVVVEVPRLDHARVELQAREGGSWADQAVLDPTTSEDWPDAPEASLARGKPLVLGRVDDYVPMLVDADLQTVLEASMTSTASSATVATTEGFPSSGTLKIDDEVLTYAGTTATTFTGLVRPSPSSHAPGAVVLEVGELTYLVADHAVFGAGAVTNLRLQTSSGALVPLPADVTPTITPTAPARITLDKQPEVLASAATGARLAFVDLDTVAHSDLADAEAALALGLADGFTDTAHADLAGSQATGGSRAAALELPAGATVSRAWVVVESFGQVEVEAALALAVDAVATTLQVDSTAGWPTSGVLWLESGSQAAELVSYTGTTATTFTGLVRGLNTETGGATSHPLGARVSRSTGRVHLSLAGDAPSQPNALGDLEVKPTAPEPATALMVPASHAFDAAHTHTLDTHAHGWDSSHLHPSTVTQRVDGLAVAVKLGDATGLGDPVAQGIVSFGTVPELIEPDVAGAHDITHTNIPTLTGYDRTNWWAVLFPSEPFQADDRPVLAADFFVAVSATGAGGVQEVVRGVPSGPVNPAFPPRFWATAAVPIPPDQLTAVQTVGGDIALGGLHGTFVNDLDVTPSSPANGGDLDLVDTSGVKDVFDVWGRDEGDGSRSLPVPQAGYVRLGTEWVRYTSASWADSAGEVVRLSGITRAAFSSTATTGLAGTLAVTWPPRHVVTPVAFTQAGVGLGGTGLADQGVTMAELAAAPGEIHVLQSRLGPVFGTHDDALDGAPFRVTAAEFMHAGTFIVPGGSLVPFDEATTDIFYQYGLSTKIVPRAPVLWVQAHTNLQVHAAWLELALEDETSAAELDPIPAVTTTPEAAQPLGTSILTWFDVSDLVSDPDDLVGAAVTVARQSVPTSPDDLLVLRIFHVLELEGVTTTTREFPTRLVCDVRGAGITSPAGTADLAELIRQVPIAAFGLTPGDVLDEAAFTAAGALTYQDTGAAVTQGGTAEEVMHTLAEQGRLVLRWDNAGKLSPTYLADRDSLGATAATFTEDDVGLSSLRSRRGKRTDVVNDVTVRAGRNMLEDDAPVLTATASVAPADRPLELDAVALDDQADADDLAAHVVDYGSDVPVRVSWDTFVQGLEVLPGDLLELDHPDLATTALLVERVTIQPNVGRAAFVTIEARDLTPPP